MLPLKALAAAWLAISLFLSTQVNDFSFLDYKSFACVNSKRKLMIYQTTHRNKNIENKIKNQKKGFKPETLKISRVCLEKKLKKKKKARSRAKWFRAFFSI